jgi:hypothetical protein
MVYNVTSPTLPLSLALAVATMMEKAMLVVPGHAWTTMEPWTTRTSKSSL